MASVKVHYKDIDIERGAENVLAMLDLATEEERIYGARWYHLAHDFALEMGRRYDLPLAHSAGIIAALSPGISIVRNLLEASIFCESHGSARMSTYPKMVDKAELILSGRDPRDVLGTRKVFCFWTNIVNPGTAGRVTIDRHSAKVPIDPMMPTDAAFYFTNTDRKYETMEKIYKVAAERANMLPHALQAITWVTYRRLYVKSVTDQFILFDV